MPGVERFLLSDHEQWLERRRGLLNASDFSCLFGLHPYRTIAGLTASMRGQTGLEPDPENPLIRRGHALEDDAADEVRRLRPEWQIEKNEYQYVDRDLRIGISPDHLGYDPARDQVGVGAMQSRNLGSLQMKVVSERKFKKEFLEDTPPLYHLIQLSVEMMILPGCTWGALCALVVGEFSFDAHIYTVERNLAAETRLRTAALDFWKVFDSGGQPAIDFERDGALIAMMFPHETPGKVIDLSQDNMIGELLERRDMLKATSKDIEKRLKTCENEIKAKIGDAEGAILRDWRVTLKTINRAGFVVEPTSYRQLRATRL